jgi:hypothetical protein
MIGLSFLALLEMFVEPGNHAPHDVAAVVGLSDEVPFARIDHELRFYPESPQGVPELVRLRHGHSVSRSPTRMSVGVLTFLMNVIGELRA